MNLNNEHLNIKKIVEKLIESGSNYRLEELEKIYSKELKIVMVSPTDDIMSFNYDENMEFFKSKKENGDAPLDTSATFKSIEVDRDFAYVVLLRHMNLMRTDKK